jgi:hypothetical protein
MRRRQGRLQITAVLDGVAFKLGQVRDRADEGVLSF